MAKKKQRNNGNNFSKTQQSVINGMLAAIALVVALVIIYNIIF